MAHPSDKRFWTADQQLGGLVNFLLGWNGDNLDDIAARASAQTVNEALDAIGGIRRRLLASKRDAEATCPVCGESFTPLRSTAVYDSSACRQRAYRERDAAHP